MASVGRLVRCPLLVGRDEALRAVRAALQAPRGSPVVRVFGEAGVGKSRLVGEAVRELAQRRRVLTTASFEADRLLPFAAFLDLLTRSDLPGAEHLVEGIAALARDATGSDAARELRRRRLLDELAEVLLVEDVLLVFEDLHWSDEAGLDALAHLARRAGSRPRLLVTYRDEEVGAALGSFLADLDRHRLAVDVPLRPLPLEEVARMVLATTGGVGPRRGLELLCEVTEGNPFFIEEVLGALPAGDLSALTADDVPVPRTVREAVRRRTESLGAAATRLLHIAAACGRDFDLDLLAELVDLDDAALEAAVRELLDAQLAVQTADGAVAFRHELTRQAVYDRLIGRERRRLHARVAEALAQARAEDVDALAGDLAHHYSLAGEWEHALVWAERAGRRALALHSPRAAQEQFDRAVHAAGRLGRSVSPSLLWARGRARELAGDLDAAVADHEAALRAGRQAGDLRAQWENQLALGALRVAGDWARAEADLDAALALARRLDDPVAVGRTLNRIGNLHMIRGHQDEARRLHEEALGLFEGQDAPHDLAATLDLLAVTTLYTGDLRAACDHYVRVEGMFRDLDDRPAVANALTMRGLCAGAHFLQTFVPALHTAEGVSLAEQALTLARRIGWHGESFVRFNLASLLAEAGRLGDALEHATAAFALAEEMTHLPWMVLARFVAGLTLLDAMATDEALDELAAAVELGESFQAGVFLSAALTAKARADAALGRLDDAAVSIRRAEEADPSPLTRRAASQSRVVAHLAAGDAAAALRLADELIATAPGGATGRAPPVPACLRAEALLAAGRVEEAAQAFAETAELARAHGKLLVEWQALAGLARSRTRQEGRPDEAWETAQRAVSVVDYLAASLPPPRAAVFRSRALRRIPRQSGERDFGGLTPRQQEVAALVAGGLSNREIAERLFISPLTAETHVKHILTRLGFSSRAQVASWAAARGLVAQQRETRPRTARSSRAATE